MSQPIYDLSATASPPQPVFRRGEARPDCGALDPNSRLETEANLIARYVGFGSKAAVGEAISNTNQAVLSGCTPVVWASEFHPVFAEILRLIDGLRPKPAPT